VTVAEETAGRLRSVERRLDRYKTLAVGGLLDYLPRAVPGDYLWELAPTYAMRPGKGLRPALCLATCRAYGGDIRLALHCSVALEMLHNAFLVHDDVEDGSEQRRGGATLNSEYGVPIAVNVGDALNALSLRVLMDSMGVLGPDTALSVFREVDRMVRESVEGQALELGWIRDNVVDLTSDDYLRMVLKKTCWYTCIEPCRIGALVATAGHADLSVFDEFGFFMGAAFQIRDDLLNLVGATARYGKEPRGDILEGKRTLMLVHAHSAAGTHERARLRAFLELPRRERSA
jgi:geranylgeranyl diphosphate synthase type II